MSHKVLHIPKRIFRFEFLLNAPLSYCVITTYIFFVIRSITYVSRHVNNQLIFVSNIQALSVEALTLCTKSLILAISDADRQQNCSKKIAFSY